MTNATDWNVALEEAATKIKQWSPDNANTNAFCAAIRSLKRDTAPEVHERAFGPGFDKPCAAPNVTECRLSECQEANRCKLDTAAAGANKSSDGEGPEQSTLAADISSSPSESRRGGPSPECKRPAPPTAFGGWNYCEKCGARNDSPCGITPSSFPAREAIARVICKSRTCEGVKCCQWPSQGGRVECPVRNGNYNDAADAILALLGWRR